MFCKQFLSFHSNLVVRVYVFQFLPACGVWGTSSEWELEVHKQQTVECWLSKVPYRLKQEIAVSLSCWLMCCTETRCFQHFDIQAPCQSFAKCQFCHVSKVNWGHQGPSLSSECGIQRVWQDLQQPSPGIGWAKPVPFSPQQVKWELLVCQCAQGPSTVKSTYPQNIKHIFFSSRPFDTPAVLYHKYNFCCTY